MGSFRGQTEAKSGLAIVPQTSQRGRKRCTVEFSNLCVQWKQLWRL